MCGIAGIITDEAKKLPDGLATKVLGTIAHRGPDGQGVWRDADEKILLLHQRLSIIDPTAASDQPLRYMQYIIIFNGEIYNYRELKAELKNRGYQFSTSGDTEVIPAAYDCWGSECLHRLDGMFSFALYDSEKQKMLLARDRFGEKPLYFHARYAQRGRLDYLMFGSEMKALWAAGAPRQTNHTMMLNYLSLGYVQNPIVKTDTFYKEILNLPPGYLLEVDTAVMRFTMKRWYEPYKRITHLSTESLKDENKIVETFHELLLKSVQLRLRSDVPVGTSLSGGLDSSSIVAIIDALKQKHAPVEGWANVCFSAVFPGFEKDESAWSAKVAGSFGIQQYLVEPTVDDLTEHFQTMVYHQEEPVQSSSVFTQYMVYRKAKEEAVSVLLDGQGADEILSGYSRYSHWYLQQLLRSSRKNMLAEKALLQQNGMLDTWGPVNYAAAWLPHQTAQFLKRRALKQQREAPLLPEYFEAYRDDNTLFKPEVRNLEDILYFNTFNFGLEELLRYADRNSMAHGREVRLPFLSHELVAFIFSLPAHFKIRQGFGKWILRKAVDRYLPADITWRKGKVGFEPPQQQWLQDASLQQMMVESKRKLVEAKMILPIEMQRPVGNKGAHEGGNYDWRYLCASSVLS
jgi:asparagine synthase (glutamine-hydrolysing)